ncbi:M48 family metallopeptidase [Vitiosangium sp. GDMCC 1.1324]|uniref:tetratricopeptide repeat protein n=1 Tax=Vitiosangium sp. (strain GDMCC 1.1324) TaxID=2138576 RepID=UPI000D349C74|nr:tetratricopeptide repeat protein [Vitiosangium sp. GDMCC 1.1324]PTL75158.1 tetratricopeptide repeat-containing protein [Vitiosangium sp. GDMCC 1.1324]
MSRSRFRRVAFLLLTSACATAPRPASEPASEPASGEGSGVAVAQNVRSEPRTRAHAFLSPSELIQRLQSSPVEYLIRDLESLEGMAPEQLLDFVWPYGPDPIEYPVVELTADGTRVVRPARFDSGAMALIEQAEPHYRARRYEEAEKLYTQALAKEPGNYLAALGLGDVALFSGDPKTALTRYEQATRLNPDDHRSYFFRATAFAQLGRFGEARDMYAWALALRPEHPYVTNAVTSNATRLGIQLQPRVLRPRTIARPEGKGVTVYVEAGSAWMVYGLCKAFWLGDEGHREEMTGERAYHRTDIEEFECLSMLGVAYSHREEGKPQDPALERFLRIAEEGYGKELIFYEVIARQAPHVALTLASDERERLHQYVLRYVLRYVLPLEAGSGDSTASR